jgi:prephenate dehydrogenase
MWRDIALANKDALVVELDAFIDKLGRDPRPGWRPATARRWKDLFSRAREARH